MLNHLEGLTVEDLECCNFGAFKLDHRVSNHPRIEVYLAAQQIMGTDDGRWRKIKQWLRANNFTYDGQVNRWHKIIFVLHWEKDEQRI